MSSFRDWYIRHQDAITWFLIGFLTADGINNLAQGKVGMALISFGIALLNFFMAKERM